MRATTILTALILMLGASACKPADMPEENAAADSAMEASEHAAAGIPSTDTPESTAAVTALPDAPKPTDTATVPTEAPEPTAAATVPVNTPEPVSEDDAGEIYATAVREIYTVDHSFGGDPPDFPFVYIVTTTSDGALLDMPDSEPQDLTAGVQQAVEAGVADLPFEVFWIAGLDEAPVDPNNGAIADGQGIVITLGNILPQADGTVQLPVFMVCGGLCALGKVYVLERVGGAWQVTGSVGPEIMA